MFNTDDMILPEGFNPEAGDQNFDESGELVDAPVVTEPTTADVAIDTPDPNAEGVAEDDNSPAPTIDPVDAEAFVIPQTVKIRYNHEDRELSLDEAAVYAQKGMNFDKVEQRSREQEAKLSRYEDMAKLFGYENADAMMQQAEKNFVDIKVKDLVDQGNTEAMARFLVNQEMSQMRAAKPVVETSEETPKLKSNLSPERRAELEEFNRAYPNVTKIPDEVFAMHMQGMKLKTAYDMYEKQQALAQANRDKKAALSELAILKQNQAAAAKGPVTGTIGKAAPEQQVAEDPFLKGFDHDRY